MLFLLPPSYAAYAAQKEVRAAVDHVLGSKQLDVPSDLDWDQLPDFHAAVLAAHQVRCEYASALCGLWDEIWQKALDSSGLEFEALSVAETQEWQMREWKSSQLETNDVWDSKWFSRPLRKNGFCVYLGVWLEISGVRLGLWFARESDDQDKTPNLSLEKINWSRALEDDDYYYTGKGIAPISGDGIELDGLNDAAKQALAAIDEFMPA